MKRSLLKRGVLFFFLVLISLGSYSRERDTLKYEPVRKAWFQTNAFKFGAAPAALIGLGILELNNEGICSNYRIQREIQKDFPGVNTRIDDVMPSMPGVLVGGLYLAGVKGRNTPVNAAIMFFGANALSGFIGDEVKKRTHIQRPNCVDYLSFPSNHTIAAFMAAEFLHQEYKDKSPWISAAGYTMAATVGSIRMLENRHWLSDVLAGAGIGILSTRITYAVYPWLHNMVFKKSRKAEGFSFAPATIDGKPGATLSYSF